MIMPCMLLDQMQPGKLLSMAKQNTFDTIEILFTILISCSNNLCDIYI